MTPLYFSAHRLRWALSVGATLAAGAAVSIPTPAHAADDAELRQLREDIQQMKQQYEARIQALEQRLRDVAPAPGTVTTGAPPPSSNAAYASAAPAPAPVSTPAAAANAFNPQVSLILGGAYAHLRNDPADHRLQGFIPSGSGGAGPRGFNLGESELTLSANVDPYFAGRLTTAFSADNKLSVEEAFVNTTSLSRGFTLKAGRFLSSLGYLNSQHAHAWDFLDAPLAYQAFLGGPYKQDGVQVRWLAPTDRFVEVAFEAGRGAAFPGSDSSRNGIGAAVLSAHVGDDWGDSTSWRLGASYLATRAIDRSHDAVDAQGNAIKNSFAGNSRLWVLDGVIKWAPGGNATRTNFKLQGEYFRRTEGGTLTYDSASSAIPLPYASAQSGWYLQGTYQFMPRWRVGLRYDQLYSGSTTVDYSGSSLTAASLGSLAPFNPSRSSVMLDYSPSEFSRWRLQYALDQSRPGPVDRQIFLQYIMSLGTHGAHAF